MSNGTDQINGRTFWMRMEFAAKIANFIIIILIIPLIAVLWTLSIDISQIKTQMSNMPRFDDLKAKIAVIEDRQNSVRIDVAEVKREFQHHQIYSDYDPESPRYKEYIKRKLK